MFETNDFLPTTIFGHKEFIGIDGKHASLNILLGSRRQKMKVFLWKAVTASVYGKRQ